MFGFCIRWLRSGTRLALKELTVAVWLSQKSQMWVKKIIYIIFYAIFYEHFFMYTCHYLFLKSCLPAFLVVIYSTSYVASQFNMLFYAIHFYLSSCQWSSLFWGLALSVFSIICALFVLFCLLLVICISFTIFCYFIAFLFNVLFCLPILPYLFCSILLFRTLCLKLLLIPIFCDCCFSYVCHFVKPC